MSLKVSPHDPAVATDTRALDFPSGIDLVILPHRVVDAGALIPTFEEDLWDLGALEQDPSRRRPPIDFRRWNDGFRIFAKHVAYALINHGNPPNLVEAPNSRYAEWPEVDSVKGFLGALKTVVDWMVARSLENDAAIHIVNPADLDSDHLDDARRWIEGELSTPRTKNRKLEAVYRVWFLSPWLPPSVRWPEPSWVSGKWRHSRPGQENRTERIPQAVMGPLLEWATSFVEQFADEILEAHAHYQDRQSHSEPRRERTATSLLDEYVREGWSLPEDPTRPGRVSWQAVEYAHPGPIKNLAETYMRRYRGRIPVVAGIDELDLKPEAQFHGVKWIPRFLVRDIASLTGRATGGVLLGHLMTACLIVCSYLTGARPEEVLTLAHGAARAPVVQTGGSTIHLIDGLLWKGGRRGPDASPSKPRTVTWATIPVASTAIRVAERVNRVLGRDYGPLFSNANARPDPKAASVRITSFVNFVNERLVPWTNDPDAFVIPDDDRILTLGRFRRTLAWFISNRPNGEVTLAIQYQHVSDRLVSGYAGTKESGMRDLLLEEDWAHRRRTVRSVAEVLESGGHVAGPAAARASTIALGMPRFMTPADERRLRRDKDFVIYDNPAAVCLCVWDETRALCQKRSQAGGKASPSLLQCVDGCQNQAWTDQLLEQLENDAEGLRRHAALSPKPIAQSMIERAVRNERIVEAGRREAGAGPHE